MNPTQAAALVDFLALILLGGASHPELPKQLADPDVTQSKAAIYRGCLEAAGGQRADQQAESFCACVMTILEKNLSSADWKRAMLDDLQKRHREQQLIVEENQDEMKICLGAGIG